MADRDENGRWLVGHGQPGPGPNGKYEDWMPEMGRRLALLGLTDREIAHAFGVTHETLIRWMREHPALSEQMSAGRTIADANVAASLYQRATGMEVYEDRIAWDREGGQTTVRARKQIPPDTRACATWLGIRQRRRGWGASIEQEATDAPSGSGALPADLAHASDAEIEERLRAYERRRQQEGGE